MAATQVNTAVPKVVIVQLSEAFGDVWGWLADELGDTAEVVLTSQGIPDLSDVAIVLLSAGAAERDALAWLESNSLSDDVPAIVVGIDYGRRLPVQAVKAGATDYFALPDDLSLVRSAITTAVERRGKANGRHRGGEPSGDPFAGVIGESDAMQAVLERASWLIEYSSVPAIVVGDPGTGKEFISRAVHDGSARQSYPFVAVDCASIAGSVHLDLFGHVEDPSTNMPAVRPGLLEVAEGGTVLLRNLQEVPVDVQDELARILRTGATRRAGGTREHRVSVRIIATCREEPELLAQRGKLHPGLYSRMGVVTLRLPPLQERERDVVSIARAFVTRITEDHGLPEPSISPDVEQFLLEYPWPGNVRQLKTVLARGLLLSPPGDLSLDQLRAAVDVAAPTNARLVTPEITS